MRDYVDGYVGRLTVNTMLENGDELIADMEVTPVVIALQFPLKTSEWIKALRSKMEELLQSQWFKGSVIRRISHWMGLDGHGDVKAWGCEYPGSPCPIDDWWDSVTEHLLNEFEEMLGAPYTDSAWLELTSDQTYILAIDSLRVYDVSVSEIRKIQKLSKRKSHSIIQTQDDPYEE